MNYPIVEIGVKNYKNLSSKPVNLTNLNILIGPNGSGKSNFVALLKFLQQCIIDSSELERGRTSFEDAVYNLGADRILDGRMQGPANVELNYSFDDLTHFFLTLLVQSQRRQVIIDDERLARNQGKNEPFYFFQAHNQGSGRGVVSVYDDTTLKGITHYEKITDIPVNDLVLANIPKLLERSEFSPEQTPVFEIRRKLIETIRGWRFYNANNMNLGEIRRSEPQLGPQDEFISSTGENLALVFHNLVQSDFEFEEQINQLVTDILPETRRIRAATSGRLRLTIEWYVEGIDNQFFLDQMSDGTVRMLCWAIILNSPRLPSLIVIDEPELGIHVSWLPKLAAWIKNAARKTQVIVSTHSPDLLDHFTDQLDTDGNILVFELDTENHQHFNVNKLTKDTVIEWLEEGWQLGDLYRVGDPSVGGWPW
ncbi:MAG: AAA family ATPase [Caldilineaceae bacterium]|nr:AAA family ATPase [Caldilineaceae bacterium]